MINQNSRYVNSLLVTVKKTDGTDAIVVTPGQPKSYTFAYSYYETNGSDRIDTIAAAYYGDATKWWKIADANPEIMKWDSITPGTLLRIPNV